ncbi:MAG TPA: hypothetical protein VFI42_08695 [Thermomicrobiaceae bacterium]|nr:hypothetical protein [Thermomicrobiaceae bacterium]
MSSEQPVAARLGHVLWIGGPPDSGKTSIAGALAAAYGLRVYHFDRQEPAHIRRADPARQPALTRLRVMLETLDERAFAEALWLAQEPEEMARWTIASWSERCGMALDDLSELPPAPTIVAEGPGFFPECVAPLLDDPRQAVWLVPDEEFKRASVARRGKPGARVHTSDPERATRNLTARDLLLGQHVREQAQARGLTVLPVETRHDLAAVTALVAAHFAPWLP